MTTGPAATAEVASAATEDAGKPDGLAYPTKRDEAWRYAPHADLARLAFGPTESADGEIAIDAGAEVKARTPAVDGPTLVVIDGRFDQSLSVAGDLPDGIDVLSLVVAVENRSEAVAEHFTPHHDGPFGAAVDVFVLANLTHGRDGVLIDVADGVQLGQPIHVVHLTTSRTDVGASPGASGDAGIDATCASVVVRLGADASATVVETHVGAGRGPGGSSVRSTVALAAGAALEHIVLQDVPDEQIQLIRIEASQAADSEYRARSFNLGGRYGRIEYRVDLVGERACADLAGLYLGAGEQILDQQVTVVHDAGDCTSRQSFRGVLDERSTGVFNGGIAVSPGADGTDAEQANDNLLLSRQAEANTQPRLEILADDVACKHGATVGQLDDNALYYLRSRGISAEDARRLLIAGFAGEIVDHVTDEAVRAWISERLERVDA